MATQTVPNRSRVCAACGTPYEPYRRRADAQRFCSDECRVWAFKHPGERRQGLLDFTPAPAPLPPVVDQRVPKQERRRLCRMSRTIVSMLRGGPVTNRQFAQAFPAGAAWRTRVSDARLWLEQHGETIRSHVEPGGLCTYSIEAKA